MPKNLWSYYWIVLVAPWVITCVFSTQHIKGFLKKTEVKQKRSIVYGAIRPAKQRLQNDFSLPTPPSLRRSMNCYFLSVKRLPIVIHRFIHLQPINSTWPAKYIWDAHNKEHLSIKRSLHDLNVHRSYLTTVFKEFHQISPIIYTRSGCSEQQRRPNTDLYIKIQLLQWAFQIPPHFSKFLYL